MRTRDFVKCFLVIVTSPLINAMASCYCLEPPSISITTPEVVCYGTDLRQETHDCGEDGNSTYKDKDGNCIPCTPCPSSCPVTWSSHENGPGVVNLSVEVSACNGSAKDSKTVVVVAVNKIEGEPNACQSQSKTYSVVTKPDGYFDRIQWWCGGANPSIGSGQLYTPTFPKAGTYNILAYCGGSSADMNVFVGSYLNAPDSEACEDLPLLPFNDFGTTTEILNIYDYNETYYSLTYDWKEVLPPTPIGACNQAVFTGSVQTDPSWKIDADFELTWKMFKLNVNYTYVAPSQSSFVGFSAGGTDNIRYKIKTFIGICNAFSSHTQYRWDNIRQKYLVSQKNANDSFSATPLVPQNCLYCCSI